MRIISYISKNINYMFSWISAVLSTELHFYRHCYKQLSKNIFPTPTESLQLIWHMVYSPLKAVFLTNIVDLLYENSKKANSVERLTWHFNRGIPQNTQKPYCSFVYTMNSKNTYKGNNLFLLLLVSKGDLHYTLICKRRCQALIPHKMSGIPSTFP